MYDITLLKQWICEINIKSKPVTNIELDKMSNVNGLCNAKSINFRDDIACKIEKLQIFQTNYKNCEYSRKYIAIDKTRLLAENIFR